MIITVHIPYSLITYDYFGKKYTFPSIVNCISGNLLYWSSEHQAYGMISIKKFIPVCSVISANKLVKSSRGSKRKDVPLSTITFLFIAYAYVSFGPHFNLNSCIDTSQYVDHLSILCQLIGPVPNCSRSYPPNVILDY